MLPRVVEQNKNHALKKIAILWETVSGEKTVSQDQSADRFIDFLFELVISTGLDDALKQYDISQEAILNLSEKTMALAGVIANNPAPFTSEDARIILEKIC